MASPLVVEVLLPEQSQMFVPTIRAGAGMKYAGLWPWPSLRTKHSIDRDLKMGLPGSDIAHGWKHNQGEIA